jgi:hypothetical protein
VSITGSTAGSATLTIVTSASSSPSCTASIQSPNGIPWSAEGGVVLAGFLLFLMPKRVRAWRSMLSLLLLCVVFAGGAIGCSGGGGGASCPQVVKSGTSTGTYVITVTGAAGAVMQTATVTVTVQ